MHILLFPNNYYGSFCKCIFSITAAINISLKHIIYILYIFGKYFTHTRREREGEMGGGGREEEETLRIAYIYIVHFIYVYA